MWELYSACKELQALDRYLELLGIEDWRSLPKKLTMKATNLTNNNSSGELSHNQSTSNDSPTTPVLAVAVCRET
jgi:hypothetical protein